MRQLNKTGILKLALHGIFSTRNGVSATRAPQRLLGPCSGGVPVKVGGQCCFVVCISFELSLQPQPAGQIENE